MSEWIKGIPSSDGEYLFATKTQGVKQGYFNSYCREWKNPEAVVNGRGRQFTHFMPLPEPPNGK